MTNPRLVTGGLLIAVPLVLVAGFTGLQMSFDYPAILRRPAGEVLTRYAAGGADMHLYWYAMFLAAVALIPAAIGFAMLNFKQSPFAAMLAGGFGSLAANGLCLKFSIAKPMAAGISATAARNIAYQ